MSRKENDFNAVAATKPRSLVPFSLRLTFEERARLEHDATGMSLGAYIRLRLFGENAAPRKTRGRQPVKDHEALGRVLGALGGSRLSQKSQPAGKGGEHRLFACDARDRARLARGLCFRRSVES